MRPFVRGALFVAALVIAGDAASAQSFQGIGFLPDVGFPNPDFVPDSMAFAVSADGRVVVGQSYTDADGDTDQQAIRWTAETGLVRLGLPGGGFGPEYSSFATGVSADGSTVVGGVWVASGYALRSFIWTESSGIAHGIDIPADAYQGLSSMLSGVSADGTVMSGWLEFDSDNPVSNELHGAVRWIPGEDPTSIDFGFQLARTTGISADGKVIVGDVGPYPSREAFRWSDVTGPELLGTLAVGAGRSEALGVSGDGSTTVGWSDSPLGQQAFVWTEAAGMVGLDPEAGLVPNMAYAASFDGSTIVGKGTLAGQSEAFVYHPGSGGLKTLEQLLIEQGLGASLAGWQLREARGVSADGLTIVGWGINPDGLREGFVATVPEPSSWLLALSGLVGVAGVVRRRSRPAGCQIGRSPRHPPFIWPHPAAPDAAPISRHFVTRPCAGIV